MKLKAYLDSLRGLKKWQRLNLQSIIEFKKGNLCGGRNLICGRLCGSQTSKFGVHKNLAGLLCQQGRMQRPCLLIAKAYLDTNKKDFPIVHIYINCLLDLGKSEEALEACDEAIKIFLMIKTILVSQASALT